jgi:RNA polymerase sigma-70 factor (sigma-E family)
MQVVTSPDETGQAPSAGRLEDLYLRNAPGALRLAYFLCGDREAAQDLVQDAFVRVVGRFAYLRTPDAFDAYLRRTVVNLFTSQLRRRRLERAHLAHERGAATAGHLDEDPALRDELWRALGTLPARQRAAIVLRYYEDLSEKDTAEILRCSVGAANQLVTRGIASLRTNLGGREA